MARGGKGMPAMVAEYNSDDDEEVLETRKQANVSMKRSKDFHSPSLTPQASSNLTAVPSSSQQRAVVPPDVSSDSGYSSRTMATVASADSSKSFKSTAGDQASSTAASDVHTITSSTCDREENSSEIFIRKGKRYVLCRDPNCKKKHRAPKTKSTNSSVAESVAQSVGGGSSTAGASPTKTKKTVKLAEPKRERQPSPKRKEKQQPPKAEHARPPTLRSRSASASDPRPRSFYGYPLGAHGPPVSYLTRYPYAHGGGQMLVNRSPVDHPQRPGPPMHRATEMSARQFRPDPYGRTPLLVQQERALPTISARKLPDAKVLESASESDDYSTDEDPEPSLRNQYERAIAHKQAVEEQRKLREYQAALKQQQERDRLTMPPPQRPKINTTQSFSMRQVNGMTPPRITQEPSPSLRPIFNPQSAPPLSKEELLYQQLQLDPTIGGSRPLLAPKFPSQPVVGMESSVFPDANVRQRRPSSFYGGESHEWELKMLNEAHEVGIRHQEATAALEQERLLQSMRAGYPMPVSHPNYGTDMLGADLRRMSLSGESESFKLREAHRHIDRIRDMAPAQGNTDGIIRRSSSKRSSHGSSSIGIPDPTTRNRRGESMSSAASHRRTESTITRDSGAGEGFKMRLDPKQDYQIEIENRILDFRSSGDGKLELCVGGKKYHKSSTSAAPSVSISAASSSVTRKTSKKQQQKSAIEGNSEEDETLLQRKRRETKGAARRRAETSSTSSNYEDSEVSRRPRARTDGDGEKPNGKRRL